MHKDKLYILFSLTDKNKGIQSYRSVIEEGVLSIVFINTYLDHIIYYKDNKQLTELLTFSCNFSKFSCKFTPVYMHVTFKFTNFSKIFNPYKDLYHTSH